MNQFERDLRESLRRREPPADFEAKVLARTTAPHASGILLLAMACRRRIGCSDGRRSDAHSGTQTTGGK